jgi:hypothetical protein
MLTTGTETLTLTADSPSCRELGSTSDKCLCDTCDNAAATPCTSNANCLAVGATTCGGKRCAGGGNNGTPCTSISQCPGATSCSVPGRETGPNACDDFACTPNTPPDDDSVNEGQCAAGPLERFCAIETFRGCADDSACTAPGDHCGAGQLRECFTDNGTVPGTVSSAGSPGTSVGLVSDPTLAGMFCAGPTASAAVNVVFGLPGLARLTVPATVTFDQ